MGNVPQGLINAAMSAGEPYTIARLKRIKPGKVIVYYSGNFDTDIHRATLRDRSLGEHASAPAYAALLQRIRETAVHLESTGKAVLSTRTRIKKQNGPTENEYVAIGR